MKCPNCNQELALCEKLDDKEIYSCNDIKCKFSIIYMYYESLYQHQRDLNKEKNSVLEQIDNKQFGSEIDDYSECSKCGAKTNEACFCDEVQDEY